MKGQKLTVQNKKITKIVVFDLDGTLLKGIKSSWTILYQAANLQSEICNVCEKKFKSGEITYSEWIESDFQRLRIGGLTKEMVHAAVRDRCSLTVHFRQAIEKLKNNGCAVGIISGGVDTVLYSLVPDADTLFDGNIYVNRVKFSEDGTLRGIEATPYDWDDDGKVRGIQGKSEGLKRLCEKYGLTLEAAVFVGDEENDFKEMRLAGKKILYSSCTVQAANSGTGNRTLPEEHQIVSENDLMLFADLVLNER